MVNVSYSQVFNNFYLEEVVLESFEKLSEQLK